MNTTTLASPATTALCEGGPHERPYTEHCPTCRLPVDVLPLAIWFEGADGVQAAYRCGRCGHSWLTGWLREPTEEADCGRRHPSHAVGKSHDPRPLRAERLTGDPLPSPSPLRLRRRHPVAQPVHHLHRIAQRGHLPWLPAHQRIPRGATMSEFRIDYTITRQRDGEADFTEVGFGSSGAWSDLNQCAHTVSSAIQNRKWETEPGHPDPAEVDR